MMDPIVAKIGKLLGLARGRGATAGEAAAAAAKVQELLLEHNLTMEHVGDAAAASCYEEECHRLLSASSYRSGWESVLARIVGKNLLCAVIRVNASREVLFIGKPHNIAAAVHLVVYLQREIARRAAAGAPRYRRRSSRDRWRQRFSFGAVHEIGRRLEEERIAMRGEVVALVLRTDAALEAEVKRRHPDLRLSRVTKDRIDSAAYFQGRLAGRGIPLRNPVATRGRRELVAEK